MINPKFIIEPKKGLSYLTLDSSINFIISEIRSRGEEFEQVELIASENQNEPTYLNLVSSGIRLRFNSATQKLELIEIETIESEKDLSNKGKDGTSFYYKDNIIFSDSKNNNPQNYNSINSLFGVSSPPKLIDSNRFILLRYDGISFLFENNNTGIEENSSFSGCEAPLVKIAIFSDIFLKDSINKYAAQNNLVKIEIDKGIIINLSDSEEVSINFNEDVESVLRKLKNPNSSYYKTNVVDEYINLNYNSNPNIETSDMFLNYYNLGIDILIDSSSHKVKKIILHSNNPFESLFGIYDRCNYFIEFNKSLFKKVELENNQVSSRRLSEDSNSFKNNYDLNLSTENPNFDLIYDENNLGFGENNTNNTFNELKIEKTNDLLFPKERKDSKDKEDYLSQSNSMNEMNESLSEFNISGDLSYNINILPTTNFNDVLTKVNPGSYVKYIKNDSKLKIISKYYAFDGIIFETMENYSLCSVTLFKQLSS